MRALGNFESLICSNFNGEATIVGEADSLEVATKRRRALLQTTFGL
jgi:hypothetical protein